MTCYEKLVAEHPEKIKNESYIGIGCPGNYGYHHVCYCSGAYNGFDADTCKKCWNHEVLEEKPNRYGNMANDAREILDAFSNAGFARPEAFEIVKILLWKRKKE